MVHKLSGAGRSAYPPIWNPLKVIAGCTLRKVSRLDVLVLYQQRPSLELVSGQLGRTQSVSMTHSDTKHRSTERAQRDPSHQNTAALRLGHSWDARQPNAYGRCSHFFSLVGGTTGAFDDAFTTSVSPHVVRQAWLSTNSTQPWHWKHECIEVARNARISS